jgi:multidrug efflux system outer membrane protein
MRTFLSATALALSFLLSGCLVGPRYKRPAVTSPPVFRGQQGEAQKASIADLPWWEIFQDETLRDLIKTALANNNDLRIAAARVEQARQFARMARSEYHPGVGYQASISGGKNEFLGSPGDSSGKQRGAVGVVLGASWEADVWGRIRRSNEYALAAYLGTEHGRRGVMLSLVSNVAQAYFELLELDLRLEIARRNVKSFQESLNLFESRLNAGAASRLETSRAQGAVSTTAAVIPELERQIAIQENQIRILLGAAPGAIPRKGTLLEQTLPPEVPQGLPSSLLERRPDVLQAETVVRAANAQIGIAAAAAFPRIGLTALFGRTSGPLEDFTLGRKSIWSVAGSAAGPIWEGGSIRAQKRQAVAIWEQTRIGYEQTVLGAFRDVSNALITRQKLEEVRAQQMDAVKAYRAAVDVALKRYTAGRSSYFEVLDAQQQLFPAENALAQTELNRRLVIVQLYQALGGGWNLTNAQWSGPPAGAPAPPHP